MSTKVLASPYDYVIPGNPHTDEYLLPVSGGADSSVLAILLHEVAPHINFRMVFTDTGAEEAETLATLDRLETWIGRPIERLMGMTLFDLIEKYNGFLPSPSDRWCTKELKLVPFRRWIMQFEGRQKFMFVGIRSDESQRLAFALDDVETEMPFVDLGIDREWVYKKLAATIGVPRSYQTRSRSGCTTCPYQRTSEVIGLLQRAPDAFERGAQCEKLSDLDLLRHEEGVPLWQDTRIARNWHGMPFPSSDLEIEKGKLTKAKKSDLFGARVFVAGEFFMDGMFGEAEFVWHQRLICYSTTLAGLKKQIDGRYQHLLSASEAYHMDPDDVRQKARFAIWYIEMPDDIFDPAGPGNDSYTWGQGKSYRQIRHVTQWAERVLHAERLREEAELNPPLLSVQYEWTEAAGQALRDADVPVGKVLLSQWYRPKEEVAPPETEEEELLLLPCPMCHI